MLRLIHADLKDEDEEGRVLEAPSTMLVMGATLLLSSLLAGVQAKPSPVGVGRMHGVCVCVCVCVCGLSVQSEVRGG